MPMIKELRSTSTTPVLGEVTVPDGAIKLIVPTGFSTDEPFS